MSFRNRLRNHSSHLVRRHPDPPGDGGSVSPPPPPPPAAPVRPDGLGDTYWDAKDGVKWADINAHLTEYSAYTASLPKDEASINWSLGDDPLDPDDKDTVYEVNRDDPMLKAMAPILIQHKASQPLISALTRAFAAHQIAQHKEHVTTIRGEEQKLGEKFKERMDGVEAFVATTLAGNNATEAQKQAAAARAKAFRGQLFTADAVMVLEEMQRQMAGPNPPPPAPPPPPGPGNIPQDDKQRAEIWKNRGQNKP